MSLIKKRFSKNSAIDVALMQASSHNDYELVEKLLKEGANPNVKSDKGKWTPLHYAAYSGSVKVTKLLLSYKAGYFNNEDGDLAIDIAKRRGHKEVFKVLSSYWEKFWEAE